MHMCNFTKITLLLDVFVCNNDMSLILTCSTIQRYSLHRLNNQLHCVHTHYTAEKKSVFTLF